MSLTKTSLSRTESAIRSLTFFQTLDDAQITVLSDIAYLESYPASYLLYYEGNRYSRILFLLSGLAKAYKIDKYNNEIFLYHIFENTLLSDISSLQEDQLLAYANISIEEDAQILSIDYKKFRKLFIDTNLLSREISSAVIVQSQQLQALIDREFVLDSVAKVSMMLDKNLNMFNKCKRAEISLILHLQPATLSRVLNRLKHDKIITIERGEVGILAPERLQSIYQGLL